MFTRIKQSRNSEYLQVVESYRDGGRVRQRLVMYVGHYDSLDDALERLPWNLTQSRRWATVAEKKAAGVVEVGVATHHREHWEALARQLRAEANRLAEKLDALRRLVEEHPDILERDRQRVERRERH